MLRSYLRLPVRTLRRRKAFTLVNALGLTVGLACCVLVVAVAAVSVQALRAARVSPADVLRLE